MEANRPPVLSASLGTLSWSATIPVNSHKGSDIKHATGSLSLEASSKIWDKHSRKGSKQLLLRIVMVSKEPDNGVLAFDRTSSMKWKLKLGNSVGFGELKRVWITLMEKPLWWRAFPKFSIGVMWPIYGWGKSTTLQQSLFSCFFSIDVLETGYQLQMFVPSSIDIYTAYSKHAESLIKVMTLISFSLLGFLSCLWC